MLMRMSGFGPVLETYSGRRVLITGASSVIGRALVRIFTGSTAELWLVGRAEIAPRAEGAHAIIADLSLSGAFARVFGSAKPHITFHLASSGDTSPEADTAVAERLNHQLLAEIAEAIAGKDQSHWPGLRLVRAGCAAEYGALDGVVREESPPHPASVYGLSMLAGTWSLSRVMQSNSQLTGRATTARLFSIFGPDEQPGALLASLIAAARTGDRLKLTRGDERRDFTYAGDIAEGLLRLGACQSAAPPVIHLASGQQITVREFAETAARELGLRSDRLDFGALPTHADDLPRGPADTTRLTRLLGWRPRTTLADGIRETARLAGLVQANRS